MVQAERQQAAASVTAPDEASMRRSIQAECDKRLKEEKLGLIKRTLAVGKKAVQLIIWCLICIQFVLTNNAPLSLPHEENGVFRRAGRQQVDAIGSY